MNAKPADETAATPVESSTNGTQDPDRRARAYRLFLEERKDLLQTAKDAAGQYAKAIMTLSAGGLALTVTFITRSVPGPVPGSVILLRFAWCFFGLSLISIVTSFFLSQHAFIRQVDLAQRQILESMRDEELTNPYKSWIQHLGLASLIFFCLGVLFTVLFSASTLQVRTAPQPSRPNSKEVTMSERRSAAPEPPPQPPAQPPSEQPRDPDVIYIPPPPPPPEPPVQPE